MKKTPLLLLSAFLALRAATAAANPSERVAVWEWEDVPKVVAIGDVHGGYGKLLQVLKTAALVDDALHWTGGETHLVVAGDFLDRGSVERPLVDLLRRLQEEAEAAGGHAHVLLGNHEVMSLIRDLRDANPAVYGEYAEEESEADRKAALEGFLRANGGKVGELTGLFQQRFPRGYFARLAALNRDGEYGEWLLRRPVIVKINDIVYLHGGLTEEFAGLGVDGINQLAHDEIVRHLEQREILEAAGLVTPTMDLVAMAEAINAALAQQGQKKKKKKNGMPPELREAALAWFETVRSPVLGVDGPLWYRGFSIEDERIERDMLARSLEAIGASAMVVAHSYTGGNHITSRFHGQLFRLDHGILQSPKPLALVVDRSDVMVLDSATGELSRPVQELPSGLLSKPPKMSGFSNEALEEYLAAAPVVGVRELGRGSTRPLLVTLELDGLKRRGIFKTVETNGDRYQHEAAAYRLGRRLGLNVVPATVIREIDGRKGSLQWWVEGAVDQAAAKSYGFEFCEAAVTAELSALAEVFDFLIGNTGRQESDVLCLVNGEQVFLIDHSKAFLATPEATASRTTATAFTVAPELAEALRSLDRKALQEELGKLLAKRQIEAVLARRDQVLVASP